MTRWLRYLQLDKLSFWIGFLAATLFWWFVRLLRPYLRRLWESIKKGMQSARQGLQTSSEQRHRNDTLKHVQGLHLAAPLFSLDEVLIAPRLLAPPAQTIPDEPPPPEDVVSMTVPYAPDWPELASAFGAHTLDPLDALQGGVHLAIIGQPGSGKTTALAYIASKIARQAAETGQIQNHLPVFIHAADLDLTQTETKSSLQIIIDSLAYRTSALAQARLPDLLKNAFEHGEALLLIDGLDELAPDPLKKTVNYLEVLLKEYPQILTVVSASPYHLDRLPVLGFVAIPMALWDSNQQAQFIQQWGQLWDSFIVDRQKQEVGYIDPLLLNGWLLNMQSAAAPLEFTLKVWATFAGDVRGPRRNDALEAYVQRMSLGISKGQAGLEQLASQMILAQEAAFTQREARSGISEEEASLEEAEPDVYIVPGFEDEAKSGEVAVSRVIPDLTQRGLLVGRANNKLGFVHPLLAGYLAAQGLAKSRNFSIFSQPAWPLKDLAVQFIAAQVNLENQVKLLLATQDPIYHGALTAGRWLQDAPLEAGWRKPILQQFSGELHKESDAMGLRLRVLAALATSGDPGVQTLFRHLLKSGQSNVRQLAALGCGFTRDVQAVGDLTRLLGDISVEVGRAACLALVKIGTKPALEAVASVLLQGTEELRRAAAEAFATHPGEGHPTLREGIKLDDLLVRRAVIYGLKRVNQPWAIEILEDIQIEDAQWVVKNAAQQAMEELHTPDASIPQPLLPLENTPWLIEFASNKGVGISAGEAAREMLLQALSDGNDEEQLAALGQILRRGETGVFPNIYHLLYGPHPDVSEAAFNTLWHIASMGVELPLPAQYGLG